QQSRNHHSYRSLQQFPSEPEIKQVASEINCNQGDTERPSPGATPKPANASDEQGCCQEEEGNGDKPAERDECGVSLRIQMPCLIENRARNGKCKSGIRCHRCSKEKENSQGDKPRWTML